MVRELTHCKTCRKMTENSKLFYDLEYEDQYKNVYRCTVCSSCEGKKKLLISSSRWLNYKPKIELVD